MPYHEKCRCSACDKAHASTRPAEYAQHTRVDLGDDSTFNGSEFESGVHPHKRHVRELRPDEPSIDIWCPVKTTAASCAADVDTKGRRSACAMAFEACQLDVQVFPGGVWITNCESHPAPGGDFLAYAQ